MKKIACIVVLLVACHMSHAQITAIPKAGLTSFPINIDDYSIPVLERNGYVEPIADGSYYHSTSDARTGLTLGVAMNVPITRAFSIQPEISFIQKNYSLSTSLDLLTTSPGDYFWYTRIRLHYVEIPFLAKYTFSLAQGAIQLFVEGGPSLAVGVGGKATSDATWYRFGGLLTTHSNEYKVKFGSDNVTDDTYPIKKRTDIGLQAGLGVLVLKKVMLDVRYTHGMTKMVAIGDNAYKSRTLQLTVGLPLTLK